MLLHQHFVRTAKNFRNKVAFIDRNTNRKITYSKALIASLILARRFRKYRDGCIGIMIPTSAGCALSIIASLMSGKTPVMINYSTGADRNAIYAQKKCGFSTIIASRALLEKIHCPPVDGMVFIEDIMDGLGRTEKLAAAAKSTLPAVLLQKMMHAGNEKDNAVILFTSGSEKDPKTVPLTHRNIGSNIEMVSTVFNLTANDRMLANLPYFHVFGLAINLWLPLYKGMTIILYANPLDYNTVCSIIREEKPTMMVGTPS
ncbi:MAG: AMP-binding protein, partial [Deltaproteobacteria bacterium]|nr:AMP-binding protein [Deltaproteobacteria bacterium]